MDIQRKPVDGTSPTTVTVASEPRSFGLYESSMMLGCPLGVVPPFSTATEYESVMSSVSSKQVFPSIITKSTLLCTCIGLDPCVTNGNGVLIVKSTASPGAPEK